MPESTFIIKNPVLEDSQNYALLREAGLVQIEKLAHRVWTDYNVHDPGITLMELLCYAITDLGYRTGYGMEDLLTESINGVLQNNSNFHTAANIFPTNPVTFNDLRKWLIDIDGVRHAWISKNKSVKYCLDPLNKTLKDQCVDPQDYELPPLNGLFDVLLEYDDEDFVDRAERIAHIGPLEQSATPGSYIPVADQGILFNVRHPLILKRVYVYPDAVNLGVPDNLTIHLYRQEANGSFLEIVPTTGVIKATLEAADLHQKTGVQLDFALEPGHTYLLTAEDSLVQLYKNDLSPYADYYLSQVIDLISGYDAPSQDSQHYFFYDWEVNYAVSPIAIQNVLSLPLVTGFVGLPDNTNPATGAYINAGTQRMRFRVFCQAELRSVGVYPNAAGPVTVRLLDDQGIVLQSGVFPVANAGVLNTIVLNWSLEPGVFYLDAVGTGVQLYRTANATYPFELDNAIQILNGVTTGGLDNYNRYFFFYHWEIEYQPCPVQISKLTSQDVQLAVKDRVHAVRNLCEDFIHIRDLKVEEIGVCADIEVRPDVDITETMAEIFFRLEQYVSPPVNFYTIEELKARGKTIDQIFEGPLLDHGFIDDDEFRAIERRCFLRTSDIIQIIMDVPGVLAVKEIHLLSFVAVTPAEIQPGDQIVVINGQQYRVREEPWILELEDINFFAPDFNPERSKIIFYKTGLPYYPKMTKVLELFREKRLKNYRNKLKGHERDLPVPIGDDMALEDYYPVQHELPETYRVGRYQVPASNSNLRKAQARQLKAYLLFFEQLFVNYLAQLGHIKELFSWEQVAAKTYFTRPVPALPGLDELYFDNLNLTPNLNAIIETQAVAEERKNRFLDHLLGRFAEEMSEYSLLMYSLYHELAPARVIRDKQCFLADYPGASGLHGKSFDYRYPRQPDNLTGYQRRMYRLLGIHENGCQIFNRNLASTRFNIIKISMPVDGWQIQLLDESDPPVVLFETVPDEACKSREQICSLLDNLLPFGAEEANWRFDAVGNRWELFQICNGNDKVFGYTTAAITTLQELQDLVIAHFAEYANREGFHVIEHILLRKRSVADHFLPIEVHNVGDACDCVEVKDPYSFRATILLPSWPERFQSGRFRQYVEKMLRLEAPAHVYLKICWINHCEMRQFEDCYFAWRDAHARVQEQFKGVPDLPPGIQIDPLMPDCPAMPADDACYHQILNKLIDKLYSLTNVFPVAHLHDCAGETGEEASITLNNTSLGSL